MNFQEIKINLINIFNELIDLLEYLNENINKINKTNPILCEFLDNNSNEDFQNLVSFLKDNLKMIVRNKMKCVLFGKTSNGKSSVINALLKKKILPSSKGRTTSCFISIEGCDDDTGYIIDTRGNKNQTDLLTTLANETKQQHLPINSLLKLFLPRNEYQILEGDLEILDSPGVDYSRSNDLWINRYCYDADVFVLVVDGCSTLNETERSFFVSLMKIISKPNIFVLVNKWDLVEDVELDSNKIRNQHFEEITRFLSTDLKIYSVDNIHNRVFFISALNALLNEDNSMEFRNFENFLNQDLNANAIETKFKKHLLKGREISNEILQFLSAFPCFVHKVKPFDSVDMKTKLSVNSKNIIDSSFGDIMQRSKYVIALECPRLSLHICKVIDKESIGMERTMKIIEDNLTNKICQIFENQTEILEENLKQSFIKDSCIKLTKEQITRYFKDNLSFDEINKHYKRNIRSNFENVSEEMKRVIETQNNNRSEIITKMREILKVAPPILMAAGTAMVKINPTLGAVMSVAGAITSATDMAITNNENKINLEDNITNELNLFFTLSIERHMDQINTTFNWNLTNTFDKYIQEQKELNDLYDLLDDIKIKWQEIHSKLQNINLN